MSSDPTQPPAPGPAPVPTPLWGNLPRPAPAPGYTQRFKWLALQETPGGEYSQWYVLTWLNHPAEFSDAAESFDIEKKISALGRIFLEHNDWPDPTEPGKVLPPTTDPEFWRRVPDEVFSIMTALLRAEKNRIPNSIRQASER